MSWDCSELTEAARLLHEMLPGAPIPAATPIPARPPKPSGRRVLVTPPPTPAAEDRVLVTPPPGPTSEQQRRAGELEVVDSPSPYRGDRLEEALRNLCRRAGFEGAVVADASGLPLAEADSPVDAVRVAAFTSVLGEALSQADQLLGGQAANNVSVDFNYTDKLVLRRFPVDGADFYLAVICPQEVDERGEIELTLEQVTDLLSAT